MRSYKYTNHKNSAEKNAGPSVDEGDNLVMDGMEKAEAPLGLLKQNLLPNLSVNQ